MDLLIVGNLGPVFEWVRDGIRAASGLPRVAVSDPGLLAAEAGTPAERLCWTNHLTPALAEAVHQGRLRVIATFDLPADALAAVDLTPPLAMRRIAATLYAQGDLLGAPHVMQADQESDPAMLLAHCGLAETGFPPLRNGTNSNSEFAELLAPAYAYARHRHRLPQIWPRSLLLDGDHPDQPLPRVINLTGPARTLAYGPYIGFPPGPARLSAVLAVAPSCRHAEMAIELHGGAPLGRGQFTLTAPGIFAAEIDVNIPSARAALEIRLKSTRGAIEGEIGIDHVTLTPV